MAVRHWSDRVGGSGHRGWSLSSTSSAAIAPLLGQNKSIGAISLSIWTHPVFLVSSDGLRRAFRTWHGIRMCPKCRIVQQCLRTLEETEMYSATVQAGHPYRVKLPLLGAPVPPFLQNSHQIFFTHALWLWYRSGMRTCLLGISVKNEIWLRRGICMFPSS